MIVMNESEIFKFLDERFENIEMPCFSNMNIDYVTSQLSVYRNSHNSWIILFNSVVWWPSADGLMGMIEIVGPGVVGRQGFDNDRTFIPGIVEDSYEEGRVVSISVRGEEVNVESLHIESNFDIQAEPGFWACCALVQDYRQQLLAKDDELKRFIPEAYKLELVLDEWEHPDWDCLPSKTHTFSILAKKLAEGSPLEMEKCPSPNIHWLNWLPK